MMRAFVLSLSCSPASCCCLCCDGSGGMSARALAEDDRCPTPPEYTSCDCDASPCESSRAWGCFPMADGAGAPVRRRDVRQHALVKAKRPEASAPKEGYSEHHCPIRRVGSSSAALLRRMRACGRSKTVGLSVRSVFGSLRRAHGSSRLFVQRGRSPFSLLPSTSPIDPLT